MIEVDDFFIKAASIDAMQRLMQSYGDMTELMETCRRIVDQNVHSEFSPQELLDAGIHELNARDYEPDAILADEAFTSD